MRIPGQTSENANEARLLIALRITREEDIVEFRGWMAASCPRRLVRMYNEAFMIRTLELSRSALHRNGTEPFAAVVAQGDDIVGEGINTVKMSNDPTSHGEVEAIRDACRRLNSLSLAECELYASCEPCPLCVATMTIVGIKRLYFAADLRSAATALASSTRRKRANFDVEVVRLEAGALIGDRVMASSQHRGEDALAIIKQWVSG